MNSLDISKQKNKIFKIFSIDFFIEFMCLKNYKVQLVIIKLGGHCSFQKRFLHHLV